MGITGHYYKKTFYLRSKRKWTCEICKKKNTPLDIHHIDQNVKNNNESNLLLVCKSCHKIIHGYLSRNGMEYKDYRRLERRKKAKETIKKEILRKTGQHKYFLVSDVAAHNKLTTARINQLRIANKLKYVKIGGRYYYIDKAINN